MASFLSFLAAGAAWCCCSATGSLMGSCCGNSKSGDVAPSATSGRKRSVLLLVLAIGVALIFQYVVGPRVSSISVGNYVTNSWLDDCKGYANDDLRDVCVGNNGVYRAMAGALLFFLLAALGAYCKPTANREAWPAKYTLYLFLCLGTCFVPNSPYFLDIYLNIARVGGILFIILEQIIVLDIAWNWNEAWVEKSNKAESDKTSQRWLGAIVFSCVVLFTASLIGIGLLYAYFRGCGTNDAFISITLIMSIVVTVLQLTSEEGSLLSSAVIVSYATYLCYTAVSKNPDASCNPQLGEQDILGILLGIGITIISLGWTGWSYTAEKRIDGEHDLEENLVTDEETPATKTQKDEKVTGVVTNESEKEPDEPHPNERPDNEQAERPKPVSWRINMVLAMISCWMAMALTGWGSISTGGNAANPGAGRVSMWMIVASQWMVFALYVWSLMAPRLFPNRDFS